MIYPIDYQILILVRIIKLRITEFWLYIKISIIFFFFSYIILFFDKITNSKHNAFFLYACLNETKLNEKKKIEFEGYNIERKYRTSRGGGIATLIHEDLTYEQDWLNLWRLTIATHKCSYTIYHGKIPVLIKEKKLTLTIYGEEIPIDHNPKYLGVKLYLNFNFIEHTNNIRLKCLKLLNILKGLSYKTWSTNTDQQLVIYKILIRSCMEYAAPLSLITKSNINKLQGIQYQALRIIYKAPLKSSSTELHNKANQETMKIRQEKLSSNYLIKATCSNNELINSLIDNRPTQTIGSPQIKKTLLDTMGINN